MRLTYKKVLIILVILILILFGFLIYLRYTKAPEVEKEKTDNYYNSEFLFNNDYIKQAEKVSDSKNSNKDLDIHGANNILYINLLNNSTEINNLPSDSEVYYNHLDNDCYEFAALKGNDLYYAETCLTSKNKKSFEKISSITKSVYVPNIYKKGIYVNDNPKTNFIINTTSEELKYISRENNILGLYNDISRVNPYFDYVCASTNSSTCKKLMVYVSFEKELFFNNKKITTSENKSIIVNDLFGILKVDTKENISIETLDYEHLSKYNYKFEVYVIDKDNSLFEISIIKNNITEVKKISDKIKIIDYKKDNNSNIQNVIITDTNGRTINFEKTSKDLINTSTIYDRKSLIDSLKG